MGSPISQPRSRTNNPPAPRCKSRRKLHNSRPAIASVAPGFSLIGCENNRTSHPSGSSKVADCAPRPGGLTAPEKRWCRHVSQYGVKLTVLWFAFKAPPLGWLTFRATALAATGGGIRHSNQFIGLVSNPTDGLGNATMVHQAKQRCSSNVVCSFSM